jgi:HAD superfamily hydrolase (TIGR01662 family)
MGDQCVILLGGLGTRLGAIAQTTPKPLLNVGDSPFVEVLVAEACRRGFRELLLLAGHRSEAVSAFLAERNIESRFDCSVSISIEPTPYGTGGALVHALPHLREDFLLLNGDTWFDFNWLDLVVNARRQGDAAYMALREVAWPDRYETVDLDGDRVRALHPRGRRLATATINGGVYYLTRRALEGLTCPSSLEADLLPALLRRGELHGCVYPGFFIDIGVPESLSAANVLAPKQRNRPAVFLDRDAILNVERSRVDRSDHIEWIEGAKEAVKALNDAGYYVFITVKQAEVSRDYSDKAFVDPLHARVSEQLAEVGASVDGWRKSGLGMIEGLFADWPIDRAGSLFISDNPTDIEVARIADIPGHLFAGGDLLAFLRSRGPQLVLAPAAM